MAQSSTEASRLADAAAARGLTLAAGYVFVYHPVYREMKRRIGVQAVRRMTLRWEKFGTFTDAIEQSLLCHHLALALDWLGEPKGGAIQRGPGVESACDRIEARPCLSACRGFLVHRPRGGAPGACGDGQVRRRHAPGMGWLQAVRRQGRRADRDRTFRYVHGARLRGLAIHRGGRRCGYAPDRRRFCGACARDAGDVRAPLIQGDGRARPRRN